MTREEAKKAAEVMLAYADGKDIEYRYYLQSVWQSSPIIVFDWNHYDYRVKKEPSNNIKQEPTYRSFKDKEECWNEMMKHQPLGWVTNEGEKFINIFNIDDIGVDFIYDGDLDSLDYGTAIRRLNFIDGAPFGIKEE